MNEFFSMPKERKQNRMKIIWILFLHLHVIVPNEFEID